VIYKYKFPPQGEKEMDALGVSQQVIQNMPIEKE
jgi:hypothetical protein